MDKERVKVYKMFTTALVALLFSATVAAQNVSINVLTRQAGIVRKGKTVFFEVTVNNTDPFSIIGVFKLKTQISVPESFVSIQTTGHTLPTGWEITSNNGSSITLSNGKDIIAASDSRTLLIALKGTNTGGPVILTGQLSFSNGVSPGTEPGSLHGDNPADNYSTSSCKVIK